MAKAEPPIYATLTIKHIFDECRIYQIQSEELNISHDIGTSLSLISAQSSQ